MRLAWFLVATCAGTVGGLRSGPRRGLAGRLGLRRGRDGTRLRRAQGIDQKILRPARPPARCPGRGVEAHRRRDTRRGLGPLRRRPAVSRRPGLQRLQSDSRLVESGFAHKCFHARPGQKPSRRDLREEGRRRPWRAGRSQSQVDVHLRSGIGPPSSAGEHFPGLERALSRDSTGDEADVSVASFVAPPRRRR